MSSIEIDIREENKRQKKFFIPGSTQTQKIEKWNFKVLTAPKDSTKCPD